MTSTDPADLATRVDPPFPFTALRGQPGLRLALLLAAIEPALGGVLIEGPRGTAKSTAARALAELLPDAPFVTVPLGASLEHVVGSLDLGEAMAGHALRFSPGLLARADGGLLYVDEVNLLPDILVDALLDAAASGIHTVERDGISQRHRARFTLIGTMNPDEGELRPQLLDRFGLSARLRALADPAERQAIVRERLAFDADPIAFRDRHATEQARLIASLARARGHVARLSLSEDDVQARVAELCIDAGVEGLRGDLALLRAARALAAWEEAARVTVDHVERVQGLVLGHRADPAWRAAADADDARHGPGSRSGPDATAGAAEDAMAGATAPAAGKGATQAGPTPDSAGAQREASPRSTAAGRGGSGDPGKRGRDQAEPGAHAGTDAGRGSDADQTWGALAAEPVGTTRLAAPRRAAAYREPTRKKP